jgi:hypothetical protein
MPRVSIKLAEDWHRILRHAWSVRFLVVAGVLSGLEVALPLLAGVLPLSAPWFAAILGTVVCLALIARFVAQEKVSG